MAWRVAKSLDGLLAQLNAAYPRRSKASDGGIGDAAHASRGSDHNPWVKDGATGVVTARDYTHDPANGLDCEQLYQALVASRDPRIKYVIWNRTITSGAHDTQPWKRRPYTGSNPHDKHLHLSVRPEKSRYDQASPWAIRPAAKPAPVQEDDMPLTKQDVAAVSDAIANREIASVGGKPYHAWEAWRDAGLKGVDAKKLAAEIVAKLPAMSGGGDIGTQVEAAVRRVFADAGT